MKDYSFKKDKNFIKKYKIKGDKIKVYRVGRTEKIPNTKENIDKLLKQMKEQHHFYKNTTILKKLEEVKVNKEELEWVIGGCILLSIFMFIPAFGAWNFFYQFFGLISSMFVAASYVIFILVSTIPTLLKYSHLKKKEEKIYKVKEDYEKNEYFIEHEKEFVDKRISKKELSNKSFTKAMPETFNINSIENISLDDIKKVIAYLKELKKTALNFKNNEDELGFTNVRKSISE